MKEYGISPSPNGMRRLKQPRLSRKRRAKPLPWHKRKNLGLRHLDLPEDIANREVEEEPLREPTLPPPPSPLAYQLERAAQLISTARCPLVVAGNGVVRARASAALVRFAEALNLPVTTTFMAKGTIPFAHPLALGVIGLQNRDTVSWWLDRADVVVTVGYDLVEYAPVWWNPYRDKKIVHLDRSPAEVDAAYTVAVEVTGDLSASLSALAARSIPNQAVCPWTLREAFVAGLEGGQTDHSFIRYAESFGAEGYRVEAADDLPYILQEACRQTGPVVIDCAVDYAENLTQTAQIRKRDPCRKPQVYIEQFSIA